MSNSSVNPSEASLLGQVDVWTAQVQEAGRTLLSLYRRLKDDKQALNAQMAMGNAEERVRRLGLGAAAAKIRQERFPDGLDDDAIEVIGWRLLLGSQFGLFSLHAMVEEDRSLQGARGATRKALQRAVRGFFVAFPEEIAGPIISETLAEAADGAAKLILRALDERGDDRFEPDGIGGIVANLFDCIRKDFPELKGYLA